MVSFSNPRNCVGQTVNPNVNYGGCLLTKLCPTLDTMDYSLPDSSVHGILQARIVGVDCHFFSKLGIYPGSPASQVDSLPTYPPGKSSVNCGRVLIIIC